MPEQRLDGLQVAVRGVEVPLRQPRDFLCWAGGCSHGRVHVLPFTVNVPCNSTRPDSTATASTSLRPTVLPEPPVADCSAAGGAADREAKQAFARARCRF